MSAPEVKLRVRSRVLVPPKRWPNGSETYAGTLGPDDQGDRLMGWDERIKVNGRIRVRMWYNDNGTPVYLGDYDHYHEGLIDLRNRFCKDRKSSVKAGSPATVRQRRRR